jgi:hypothetical protein
MMAAMHDLVTGPRSTRLAHRDAWRLISIAVLALFIEAPIASATVPGEVNYQGLLLDDLGTPVNGARDFEFRLFDVESGGSALWTESHDSIAVVDGVYDVTLGSIVPIPTASLSLGALYLEAAVDAETLSPRQRLLAVPYALRAAVAEETENVSGIEAAFFEAIMVAAPWDGEAPDNFHAAEGLADADSDGLPNFMDPDNDNDNDGIGDGEELLAGTDLNVMTPTLSSISPASLFENEAAVVMIFGTNFDPAMTVQIGAETGALSNVGATSADVALGPHAAAVEDVVVTLTNGQSDTLVGGIEFIVKVPTLTSVSPSSVPANTPTTLTLVGTLFEPTMTAQVGTEVGVLSNITPTSVDVAIGGHPLGVEDVSVTLSNGESASLQGAVSFTDSRILFVTSTTHTGDLGGIAAADTICGARATAAGLTGTYQAWISDGTTSPATRSTQHEAATYRSPSGVLYAASWSGLVDGSISNSINEDENGTPVPNQEAVWTNVSHLGAGTVGTNHCSGWTSTDGVGAVGRTGNLLSFWTNLGTTPCTSSNHLYCIEQ